MNFREQLSVFGIELPEDLGTQLDRWAARLTDSPLRNATALVGLSSVLFYMAERGRNPKVKDIYDAMIYCSTCISVGYADIFAKTPIGKIVGSALMTIGPSMAAKTQDGPGQDRRDATQGQILDTLRLILSKLETTSPG